MVLAPSIWCCRRNDTGFECLMQVPTHHPSTRHQQLWRLFRQDPICLQPYTLPVMRGQRLPSWLPGELVQDVPWQLDQEYESRCNAPVFGRRMTMQVLFCSLEFLARMPHWWCGTSLWSFALFCASAYLMGMHRTSSALWHSTTAPGEPTASYSFHLYVTNTQEHPTAP